MKTILILIAISLIAYNSYTQPKYTHPSYSSGNYKMPYNAKIAKELNLDKTRSYDYKESEKTGMQSSANYKNSFAETDDDGGSMPILPVETNTYGLTSGGNYKMQFKATKKSRQIDAPKPQEEPLVIKPD